MNINLKEFIQSNKISENSDFICIELKASECPDYIIDKIIYAQQTSFQGPKQKINLTIRETNDSSYTHILVFTKTDFTLVGGTKFYYHKKSTYLNTCKKSYLEYSYPGFYKYNHDRDFIELGRTYVINCYRKNYALSTLLFTSSMNSMIRYSTLFIGLMTYDQTKNSDFINKLFLSALTNNHFITSEFKVPDPRFSCIDNTLNNDEYLQYNIQDIKTLRNLQEQILSIAKEKITMPTLLKQYYQVFGTKTLGLSIGKSFNNLIEVFAYTDLATISYSRLKYFLTEKNLELIKSTTIYKPLS